MAYQISSIDAEAEAEFRVHAARSRVSTEDFDGELPAELAGRVDLDAIFGYAVRPDPRLEEERWKEDGGAPRRRARGYYRDRGRGPEAEFRHSPEDFDGESDDDFGAVVAAHGVASTGRPRHRPQPRRDRPTAAPQEGSLNITLRPRPP